MRHPILLAWSGGKDSTMALAALQADPAFDVVGLVTAVTRGYDRISIHGIRRTILEAQVASIGLPVFEAALEPASSNAQYEAAWSSALTAARAALRDAHVDVQHLAFGDLFLADVREYREDLGRRIGYTPVFPLWGRDTRALAHEFINAGSEAFITCVDTTQLDAAFAGRRFDHALLADLPDTVDPCGERGEFHTCVVNAPPFRMPVRVACGERVRRDDRFEYCDVVPMD